MRKWIVRLAVLGALVASGVALKLTVFAPDPITVRLALAERGRVESTVTNSRAGTVKAHRRVHLSPEIGGRVVELPHREGERVEAGVVLVRLDDSTHRAHLLVAQRTLEATQARLSEARVLADRAERELTRNRRLAKDGIIPADSLDQYESAHEAACAGCKTAQAQVEQSRAQVGLAEAELARTLLRAPFGGLLAELSVELGEWVTPSPPMTPVPSVIDLLDPSSLYVSAPMDEVDSAVIREGLPARVTLDPFPGRAFPGRVARVAPYVLDVEAQNRTVEVEIEFDCDDSTLVLLPGTSADVEVIIEARDDVLRIPSSTLIEGEKVLLVEEGVLVEREVQVGLKNWDYAEVVAGLRSGERVVTTLGKVEVKAGVRVVAEQDPGTR